MADLAVDLRTVEQRGVALAVRDDLAQAGTMLTNVLTMATKSVGRTHPDLISPLYHLAWVRKQQGDPATAESLHREAITNSLRGGNYSIRALTDSGYELVDLLQARGRFAEAEPSLLEMSTYLKGRPEASHLFERPLLERLALFYEAWDRAAPDTGKSIEAGLWRKQLAELNGRASPKRH